MAWLDWVVHQIKHTLLKNPPLFLNVVKKTKSSNMDFFLKNCISCKYFNPIFFKISRHYLIPYHIAKSGKFGKSGTKLHIYMDHVFVAQHVKRYIMRENNKKLTINIDKICAFFSSGTRCQVCQMNIPLRLGKQGYKCRDCSLICHKPCHIRVESHCLETSMPQMEL